MEEVKTTKNFLFVYGSLRPGMALDGWIRDVFTRTGLARTKPEFTLINLEGLRYPHMIDSGKHEITGDVYEIPGDISSKRVFEGLTNMEEGAGYTRKTITVKMIDTQVEIEAHAFIYDRAKFERHYSERKINLIETGDFSKWWEKRGLGKKKAFMG